MFQSIPGFPDYEFCTETLQVKSLGRKVKNGEHYMVVKEKILKPTLSKGGYVHFGLYKDGKLYHFKRSQISWLVNTGSLPSKPLQIDHKDAVKINDKFSNLQLLTLRQNCSKAHQQNGTKYPTGVYWNRKKKKYQAQININGKTKYLGCLTTVEAASATYQKALGGLEKNESLISQQ